MAVNRYTGGAGDFNFDTGGNWSGGAKAANGEDVVISSAAVNPINTGMDNENGVTPASITIEKGCAIAIGSSGLPWYTDTPSLKHYGSGKVYFKWIDAAAVDTDFCEVDSDAPTNDDALVLDGTGLAGLGIRKGKCTVISTMGNILDVMVSYRNNPSTDAVFQFNGASTTITKFAQCGGISRFDGGASSGIASGGCLSMSGGTCYFNSGDARYVIVTGGTFVFNTSVTLAGAIAIGTGVIDFTQSYNVKTITTLYIQTPQNLKRDESLASTVHKVTNGVKFIGMGK